MFPAEGFVTAGKLPFPLELGMLFGLLLMELAFLTAAIWKDAYFKVGDQNPIGGFFRGWGINRLVHNWGVSAFGVFFGVARAGWAV